MREEVRWLHEKFLKKPELAPWVEQRPQEPKNPFTKPVPGRLARIAALVSEKASKAGKRLAGPGFDKVAFFPHGGNEGIGGVPPAKAKEIIERFGGPEKFNARRIADKHLVIRAPKEADFEEIRKMAGPKAARWETNVWRGKPNWRRWV